MTEQEEIDKLYTLSNSINSQIKLNGWTTRGTSTFSKNTVKGCIVTGDSEHTSKLRNRVIDAFELLGIRLTELYSDPIKREFNYKGKVGKSPISKTQDAVAQIPFADMYAMRQYVSEQLDEAVSLLEVAETKGETDDQACWEEECAYWNNVSNALSCEMTARIDICFNEEGRKRDCSGIGQIGPKNRGE